MGNDVMLCFNIVFCVVYVNKDWFYGNLLEYFEFDIDCVWVFVMMFGWW